MSERAGRGEVTSLTSTGQLTNRAHPSGNTHWGPAIPDLPYSVAILEPQSVIHCAMCFFAGAAGGPIQEPPGGPARTSPKGLQGCQGPKPGQSPLPVVKVSRLSGAANTSFHNPPQPLPGLTGLQGFQAKPLQTAPWDSPISLNREMAMIGTLAGRPLGLPGLP